MEDSGIGILFAAIFIQMVAIYDDHVKMNRMEAIMAASISSQKVLSEHIQAQLDVASLNDAETKSARLINMSELRREHREVLNLLNAKGFGYLLPKRRIPPMLP